MKILKLLALASLFGLAACGDKDEDSGHEHAEDSGHEHH